MVEPCYSHLSFYFLKNIVLLIIIFSIIISNIIIIINNFFVSICTPIKNKSVLPPLLYKTNTRINSFRVTNKDILLIIQSLGSSKSHGYDNISVKMIKICTESVTIPLKIIFEESLKKDNVDPIQKL